MRFHECRGITITSPGTAQSFATGVSLDWIYGGTVQPSGGDVFIGGSLVSNSSDLGIKLAADSIYSLADLFGSKENTGRLDARSIWVDAGVTNTVLKTVLQIHDSNT